MEHIYEYLGGGAGIGAIIFSVWLKNYINGLKEEKKKFKELLNKANDDNISQEVRIARNEKDIQKLKDKIYS